MYLRVSSALTQPSLGPSNDAILKVSSSYTASADQPPAHGGIQKRGLSGSRVSFPNASGTRPTPTRLAYGRLDIPPMLPSRRRASSSRLALSWTESVTLGRDMRFSPPPRSVPLQNIDSLVVEPQDHLGLPLSRRYSGQTGKSLGVDDTVTRSPRQLTIPDRHW